jgi:ABC-type multidrug transport system fused ATPase/permease subunit
METVGPARRGMIGDYWRALQGLHRRALGAVGLAALAGLLEAAALAMLIPLLGETVSSSGVTARVTRWFTDRGLHGTDLLWAALVTFAVLGVLAAGTNFGSELLGNRIRAQVEERLRRDLSVALIETDWPTYVGLRLGDVSSAVMLEGGQTSLGAQAVVKGVGAAAIAVVFFVAGFLLSWEATLFTLGFGLVLFGVYRVTGRRAAAHGRQLAGRATDIGNEITDVMGNLKFFKSTGATESSSTRLTQLFRQFALTDFWAMFYRGLTRALYEGGGVLLVTGVIALSIVGTNGLTAQTLVFLALFYRLQPRLLVAQDNFLLARTQRPWFERWEDRMALIAPHRERPRGGRPPTYGRALELVGASYSYPGAAEPALDRVSLRVDRGECVAIVGESGSGKTTALDLLSGLLPPDDGRVVLDGDPLEDLDVAAWQDRIGLVLQETPVFHASVLDNIAWSAAVPDRVRARRAAERSNALGFVDALPDGLDSVVGERGGRLSGGQRQRIALARALYRDPWLLLLDEATSALDAASEAEVQRALAGLRGSCSIVMVAHRLATVRLADRIYVLDHGAVVEEGSWDGLMAARGPFALTAARQGLAGEQGRAS